MGCWSGYSLLLVVVVASAADLSCVRQMTGQRAEIVQLQESDDLIRVCVWRWRWCRAQKGSTSGLNVHLRLGL